MACGVVLGYKEIGLPVWGHHQWVTSPCSESGATCPRHWSPALPTCFCSYSVFLSATKCETLSPLWCCKLVLCILPIQNMYFVGFIFLSFWVISSSFVVQTKTDTCWRLLLWTSDVSCCWRRWVLVMSVLFSIQVQSPGGGFVAQLVVKVLFQQSASIFHLRLQSLSMLSASNILLSFYHLFHMSLFPWIIIVILIIIIIMYTFVYRYRL